MSLSGAARSLYRSFDDMDTVDLVARLTLIAMLVSDHVAGNDWYVKSALRGLAILGIAFPPLHRSWRLWLIATLVLCFRTSADWWFQDNHLFLLNYWCITLFLALRLPEPERAIATSARLMIGFSFAFATLWKGLLSPDYMDGSYFHFTILADIRFQDLGSIVGRVSDAAYSTNSDLLGLLDGWRPEIPAVTLQSTAYMPGLALVLTWWTVVIEGLLGLCFLWPGEGGPARIRNWVLLLFGLTTYTVATVPTFGWVLMTFGAAQCRRDERSIRLLYAVTCVAILIFSYAKILSLLRPFLPAPS